MRCSLRLFSLIVATILETPSNGLPVLQTGLPITPNALGLKSLRSTNTCADPSLSETLFQAFEASTTVHVFNRHYAFVAVNTETGSNLWTDQHPAFRGWLAEQPFTVPLFQLGNSGRTEYVYLLGPDAQTPPIISGFNTDVGVVAWVYDSPVCGSVPLLSAVFAAGTDHYYTTEATEHAAITLVSGWSDSGVVAYVLPLSSS